MNSVEKLQQLLEDFALDVRELEKRRKPGQGLLGFGTVPGDDPCHEKLDRQLQELIASLERQEGEDLSLFIEKLLGAEKQCDLPEYAHWTLIAGQRHCLPLIPALPPRAAQKLLTDYEAAYPRRKRFPAQKAILQALKAASEKKE